MADLNQTAAYMARMLQKAEHTTAAEFADVEYVTDRLWANNGLPELATLTDVQIGALAVLVSTIGRQM